MTPEQLLADNPLLSERVRVVTDVGEHRGQFVLYWMHHALRGHENPALEISLRAAIEWDLPLLVCIGLFESDPFASDRHHTFVLEGARDVQDELRGRGIACVVHVEREGHRQSWLPELVGRAALIVTEEVPVAPTTTRLRELRATTDTGLWAVDASCIVPMPLVPKAYTRAFRFRDATKELREERLPTRWEDLQLENPHTVSDLPFEPVDLNSVRLSDLIAECRIDHSVGAVPHTPGGSSAGYARWREFRACRMARYAVDRNDALLDGVSRMSPYLHYGMVSPFRIAREALSDGGAGAEKFLDELLIWRELAWSFCFHRPDHESVTALPDWARDTLSEHQADARPALYDWESLARGQTGELLWDAAQRSLLIHGELHNNVRMTWGKALLNWTPDAQTALSAMIDLNHRYALDGQDPASYGGILWCLGQFDRPFEPGADIVGCVRTRPVAGHAERLDPEKYFRKVTRPLSPSLPRVAVVGAGIAGLMCARTLADHGLVVTVFDKGRRAGGRMSTRQSRSGVQFDHGCQYFTAADDRFLRYVRAWEAQGVVSPWQGRIVDLADGQMTERLSDSPRYVGSPQMQSIARHLARELDVREGIELAAIRQSESGWNLRDVHGGVIDAFDSVICAVPAPQAAVLLSNVPDLAAAAARVTMTHCWTLMAAFEEPVDWPADGAVVSDSPIAWIARDSSKPGRDSARDCWVIQASDDFSVAHLEQSAEAMCERLLTEFLDLVNARGTVPCYAQAHRWRYAIPATPAATESVFDEERMIGLCGDWLSGRRVEAAFLSGAAATGHILRRLECV